MRVFVDTSAFLPLLDTAEDKHSIASRIWIDLVRSRSVRTCTNYVLLETMTLVQKRLGIATLRAFHDNVVPYLNIIWVDEALHQAGIMAVLSANRRQLSMVDCTSFAAMRANGLATAFVFDRHFEEQGFTILS